MKKSVINKLIQFMQSNMTERPKDLMNKLIQFMEELDLEERRELQQLLLLAKKKRNSSVETVLALIECEFFGTINANTQEIILYAKIPDFYPDRPAQLVPCKLSDELRRPLVGRPLERGDCVWLQFDPKKPSNLQFYKIVGTADFW